MSFLLRTPPILRSLAASSSRQRLAPAATTQYRFAHQSYGGGEGDPKGENPQDQGSNPSADLEHPGPPPPSVGEGTGGGPTKGSGERQNSAGNTAGSESGSKKSGGPSNGAQPKIHAEGTPTEDSADVKKHNEDMNNRHDRATNVVDEGGKDDVGKDFWKGELCLSMSSHGSHGKPNATTGNGGADRQP